MIYWSSSEERERFWQDLDARFGVSMRAYVRRSRCSEDDVDDTIGDLWQMAVEREEALVISCDPWPILRELLRELCRQRVRVWRRELPIVDDAIYLLPNAPVIDEIAYDMAMKHWADHCLASLSAKQRLAVDFRYRWNWDYWAVAAAIDVSETTARVHVHRGLVRLREIVKVCAPPLPGSC